MKNPAEKNGHYIGLLDQAHICCRTIKALAELIGSADAVQMNPQAIVSASALIGEKADDLKAALEKLEKILSH